MLDLTLLGSGGGMPMPNRHLSSMIIGYEGRKILIDCGEGTQVAMRKVRSGFRAIDIICISHYHGDHIFGLPGLLSTIGNSDRKKPITIIGPVGLKKIMEGLLVSHAYLPYKINLIEAAKRDIGFRMSSGILQENIEDEKNEIIFSTLKLNHSSPCLGYSLYLPRNPKFYPEKAIDSGIPKQMWSKLQNGEEVHHEGKIYKPDMVLGEDRKGIKLSFVTDTRPTDTIPAFIEGSDLFVCEGTYGDNADIKKAIKNKHMTFKEAADLANEGKVKELLLTHFSPAMDNPSIFGSNARSIFKNTILGYDGYKRILNYD